MENASNFVAKYLIRRFSSDGDIPIELDQRYKVDVVGRTLKTLFWATLLLSPVYFVGSKLVPKVAEAISHTRKMRAENEAKRQDQLDALSQAADLSASEDPNLLADGAAIADGSSSAASAGSVGATELAPSDQSSGARGTAASTVAQSETKTTVIEITNANMNDFWNPAAEERVQNMAISDELKRQILENYHRTGVLPEAVATNRKPAATR